MKQHIDSELVIYEVKADIEQFGGEFTVYAVHESEAVSGQPFEYISGYVDAERPTEDEADTKKEFKELIKDYEYNLASLADTKHELMTLDQLLEKLLAQDVAD
ncbi:hypothetical protein GYN67_01280 [Lactococcus piscium]|uniref:hypothetical protein n=1 Tax=Pseudolactococcus carnosus TaxID=2749961 RepID=UPI001FB880B5|nr:hypothetical protein [Lactococcus carnosus]MCJ1995324.1 hypothetical protein [Lactococcus carnosus]